MGILELIASSSDVRGALELWLVVFSDGSIITEGKDCAFSLFEMHRKGIKL